MQTSLKTGFAQIFSCCPKNLSCPKFGGAAAPLAPRPVRLCFPWFPVIYCLGAWTRHNKSPQWLTWRDWMILKGNIAAFMVDRLQSKGLHKLRSVCKLRFKIVRKLVKRVIILWSLLFNSPWMGKRGAFYHLSK